MKIVLSSNVWHYHHAAETFEQAGWLERYVTSIVPVGRRIEQLIPEYWSDKLRARALPPGVRGQTVSLTLPELTQKAALHTRLVSRPTSVWLQNAMFDRLASRQVTPCDVFHHVSSVGLRSARRARELGASIVVDERQEHPDRQHAAVARELTALGLRADSRPARWQSTMKAEYDQADFIVVGSEYAKETFVERGFSGDRIEVIPYGFDPYVFGAQPTPEQNRFTILFCGQVTPRKGVHHLVQAFRELALADAELVLIGAMDPLLVPLAAEWARIPGLRIVGEVPKLALPEHYGRASVLALPSVADAQPLACLEAMACGLPAIVTTAMGSREIVRDGVEGFVLAPGDVEALKDRLTRLHADATLVATMAEAAHERVQDYTWTSYGEKLLAAYGRMFSALLAPAEVRG
jgi:glycosyltransferase involved in cell wall biosynthesis